MDKEPWSDDEFKTERKRLKELRSESQGWYEDLNGVSKKARKEQLDFINKEIARYTELSKRNDTIGDQAKELLKLTEKQRDVYKEQFSVIGRIKSEVNTTYRQFTNFMTTYASQYNYAQKIAKEYLSVTRDIGATAGMGDRLTRTFKDSLAEVEQMGGSMEDVTNIMNTMADESGRVKILDREAITTIESIAKGTNMMASDAARMAETFDLMGVSTDQMGEHLAEVFKSSQAIGLNANKVVKTLAANMDSIQSYSFASGVKGMTEMAKQAVKMRIDVSDVLQMADKFYQPEAAIEAAANLQMLGGDIAEAFGDPFETMYLARNKPEELADRLGKMTENMMQFNSETGEYEFPAEVRMQLKAAGEQLGINTEKMVEMSRQSSKIKDLKMKFTAIGDNEMKENLSSLAKWSEAKGEFVIKHKGDELGLSEINKTLAEDIVNASQNDDKSDSQLFKNIAINTQTMSEQLVSLKESSMATIAGTTDLYEIAAENMKENLLIPMKKNMDIATTKFVESFDPETLFKGAEWDTTFNGAATEVKSFTDALKKGATEWLNSVPPKQDKKEGEGRTSNDFLMRDDGTTINFNSEDDIMGAKTGGPLDKLMDKSLPIAAAESTSVISGSIDINFNNAVIRLESENGNVALDMNKIKDAIQPIIINALNNKSRNGGVLSSKEALDNGLTV